MDPSRDPPGAPYREAGRPKTPCPRCDVGLVTSEPAGVRVDRCSRCDGLFIAPRPLLAMIEQSAIVDELREILSRDPPAMVGGAMYVPCPHCGTLMNRTQYAQGAKVVIDYCRRHGTWFERGALPAVLDFVSSGGHERAQARVMEERRQAERDARWRSAMEVARARWEITRMGRHRHVAAFFADLFS